MKNFPLASGWHSNLYWMQHKDASLPVPGQERIAFLAPVLYPTGSLLLSTLNALVRYFRSFFLSSLTVPILFFILQLTTVTKLAYYYNRSQNLKTNVFFSNTTNSYQGNCNRGREALHKVGAIHCVEQESSSAVPRARCGPWPLEKSCNPPEVGLP